MGFSIFIAKRYFQSKIKSTFISTMSKFTMVGVAFEVMALILVLSFFNGIKDFQLEFFESYEPSLKIVPTQGKFFSFSPQDFDYIHQHSSIDYSIGELKDQVLLTYGENQIVADLIGLDSNFIHSNSFKETVIAGEYGLKSNGYPVAMIGQGLFLNLGLDLRNEIFPIQIYYPNRDRLRKFSPFAKDNLLEAQILPGSIFQVDPLFDSQSLLVDINFMRNLSQIKDQYSSIRLIIHQDPESIQEELSDWLKEKNLSILSIPQQHQSVLQAIKIERLFVTLMMVCIIIVASFTLFFSLSLLVVEKKNDLKTFVSLGVQPKQIYRIFLWEGFIITMVGIISGVLLAILIAFIQENYGIIRTGLSTQLLDAYPIIWKLSDILMVSLIVLTVGFLAAIYPAKKAVRIAYDAF